MPLLSPAALAAFAGVEPEHPRLEAALRAAEALAAAWIGAAGLAARTVEHQLRPPRFRRVLELPEGPLTALLEAELEGALLDPAALTAGPWLLARAAGFRAGRRLRLLYRTGWEVEPGPPEAVVQALLLAGADQLARGPDPAAVTARLGDLALGHAPGPGGLPREAAALLRPWRRP